MILNLETFFSLIFLIFSGLDKFECFSVGSLLLFLFLEKVFIQKVICGFVSLFSFRQEFPDGYQ